MTIPWLALPLFASLVGMGVLGMLIGLLLDRWGVALTPLPAGSRGISTRGLSTICCGAIFPLLVWGIVGWQCQMTPEVTPSQAGWFWRIVFQLALLSFLWASVVTDLRDYQIPDAIVIAGIVCGLGGQFIVGEIQIQHLWIDWNAEVEGIKGPDFPQWIDEYRRLHGLAVGLTGAVVGGGITWIVRAVSSRLIGQETMGLGDVTLMAMIGATLGWQPVLFVFLLAPICGILVSLLQQFLGGKHYLPFGPFLALATLIVLLSWKWLWLPLRYVFGHPPTLLGLLGGASAAFVVLLILARLYRMIPVSAEQRYSKSE